ncbi:MAG: PorT family protein [Bacteroidales bacterium]|nr:PorT family protein [Bacteroidales bacterium]
MKIKAIAILAMLPAMIFAQVPKVKNDPTHDDKPVHFGFSLGINTMDYRVDQSPLAVSNQVYVGVKDLYPGINIHAIVNFRLAENLDLRTLPGISFNDRYLSYSYIRNLDSVIYGSSGTSRPITLRSAYLELPVLFKYKSLRLNNFRPYLIGGANYRYDLGIKREYDYEDQVIMLSKSDFYAELGFGMDFYLTFFKLGVEIKYSLGLTNILERVDRHGNPPADDLAKYTDYLDGLHSQMVIVSFHFE